MRQMTGADTYTGLTNTLSEDTIETTASVSETQPVSAAVRSTCTGKYELCAARAALDPCIACHAMEKQAVTVLVITTNATAHLRIHWVQWQGCHAPPERLAEVAF
jgi:hypothetical protein